MSVFLVFKEGFSDRPNLDLISNLNLFYPDFFPRKPCASENFYRFFHTVFTLAPKALVLESLLLKYLEESLGCAILVSVNNFQINSSYRQLSQIMKTDFSLYSSSFYQFLHKLFQIQKTADGPRL